MLPTIRLLGAFALVPLVLSTPPLEYDAHATSRTIAVNSLEDPGDGKVADGNITLREALTLANETPGINEIRFDVGDPNPRTIRVIAPLPAVTDPLFLDGFCLEVGLDRPGIEIDGGGSCDATFDGLVLEAPSFVRGVAVVNFGGRGMVLSGMGKHVVEGCYVGVSADGLSAGGNGSDGIAVVSADNRIGGTSDLAPLATNVVSANARHGIRVDGSKNRVEGNRIGVRPRDDEPLGNRACGVYVASGDANIVGGTRKASGNWIANNGRAGVRCLSARGTRVLLNSTADNGGLGIDVGAAGVGSVEGVPAPVIASAVAGPGAVVMGQFAGEPLTAYRLEFFSAHAPDPSGHGEGAFAGITMITTGKDGTADFRVVLWEVPADSHVSATATDPDGSSSELGRCVRVDGPAGR